MAFHNPMNPPARGKDAIRKKAMDQFAVPRGASHTIQHELELERNAADANTATTIPVIHVTTYGV